MNFINKSRVSLLLAGLILVVFSSVNALTIQVFADTAHPVLVQGVGTDVKVAYYNLDQLQTIIGKIDTAIQGQEQPIAEFQAKQLLTLYKAQFNHATQGINLIHQYKLTALPAIIFNQGAYQIIGQTNLALAIMEYKQWVK